MLIDLLFPKTCVNCGKQGSYFCLACAKTLPLARSICPMCGKGSIGGVTHAKCVSKYGLDGLSSIFPYKGALKVAIKRLKYRLVQDMVDELVSLAIEKGDKAMSGFFSRNNYVIVPVPLHPLRERWRGFNQAELLGKLLAEKLGLEKESGLRRVKNTEALAELKAVLEKSEKKVIEEKYRSEIQRRMAEEQLIAEKKRKLRKAQMKGAFEAVPEANLENRKVLLLDDVWTSGATMLECCRVLKNKGVASVWGFSLAFSGGY